MRTLLEKYRPVFDTGEGAGGGDGGAGDGGAWAAPEGLPEEFRGADAAESLGKLIGGFTDVNSRFEGLRDKLSKMPKAPETPDGYAFEPSDALKPYFGDADDPTMKIARDAFHKAGVPAEAFGAVIENFYGPLIEQGLLPEPFSAEKEVTAFMSGTGLDRTAAAGELTTIETFANGLAGQLEQQIPESLRAEAKASLVALTDTAGGNALLKALSGRLGDIGIRPGGQGGGAGELTAEDLKKLDADPRIDPQNRNHTDPNRRFDEDLRKRYDEAYRRLSAPR